LKSKAVLRDLAAGTILPTRAEAAEARADELEVRAAELEAEIKRLRGKQKPGGRT
jgi:hypothetical protein